MKRLHFRFSLVVISVFLIIGINTGNLLSGVIQVGNLDRMFDPVIVTGQMLEQLLTKNVNNICVYVYEASEGGWHQIPFQIDEKDGGDYFGVKNGVLDPDDEICFMAADMADRVDTQTGPPEAEFVPVNFPRYEIMALDNLNSTQSWAYIYFSPDLVRDPNLHEYVRYQQPSPITEGNDKIQAESYHFGHNLDGIPNYLMILNSDIDYNILDRWKIRISGYLSGIGYYGESEDSALLFLGVEAVSGPIRTIRCATYDVWLHMRTTPDGDPYASASIGSDVITTIFYPYHMGISFAERELQTGWGIKLLRQSIDFNDDASGKLLLYSQNNTLIPIDGIHDANCDHTLDSGVIWYGAFSHNSTPLEYVVLTIADIPDIGNEQLYYCDGCPGVEGDTGDNQSIGDMGVEVTHETGMSGQSLGLNTTMYYLGNDQSLESFGDPQNLGNSLTNGFNNPLVVIPLLQANWIVPVELVAFSIEQIDNNIILHWSTASETNNLGFEIYRQSDNTAEENDWQCLGLVEGAGTCSEPKLYSFVDRELEAGLYRYRLKQIDTDGKCTFSESKEVIVAFPTALTLNQNYPNPFNPSTQIFFEIPTTNLPNSITTIEVFNLMGQRIRVLLNESLEPGHHTVLWDGCDQTGQKVVSGTYIYRLTFNNEVKLNKMVKLQ